MKWAGTIVQYVDGDYALPYVYKDGMYYYFGETPQGYVLMMSSLHEIASSKAAQPSVQRTCAHSGAKWNDDFHAQHEITEVELSQIVDEGLFLDRFVNYCRNAYARKKAG